MKKEWKTKNVIFAAAVFALTNLSLRAEPDSSSHALFPGRLTIPQGYGSPLFKGSKLGLPELSPGELGRIFEAVQTKGMTVGGEKFLYFDTRRIRWTWDRERSYASLKLLTGVWYGRQSYPRIAGYALPSLCEPSISPDLSQSCPFSNKIVS